MMIFNIPASMSQYFYAMSLLGMFRGHCLRALTSIGHTMLPYIKLHNYILGCLCHDFDIPN